MTRTVAFTMKLKPGCRQEYMDRHNRIWPELIELLHRSGVSDYHIFLEEETDTLFAVQKVTGDSGSQDLGTTPVVKKWWDYMSDIMEVNDDNSPVTIPLEELFYLQ